MEKHKIIGQWTCPSGNSVDAILEGEGPAMNFHWDTMPLTSEDLAYYLQVIRPQAITRFFSGQWNEAG